jgi:transcriptional regulator with GAF, ATPase, and Fis domain
MEPGEGLPLGVEFERALGTLSARFIALPSDRVSEAITDALRTVVETLQTERASFMELVGSPGTLVLRNVWARPGVRVPRPPEYPGRLLPHFASELREGRPIIFGHLPEGLAAEAVAEREFLAQSGFVALLAVPVVVGERGVFALSTGDFTRAHAWTPRDVERLHLLAGILGNAYHRMRLDEELQAHMAEITSLQAQLEHENVYLREEIDHDFSEIIGHSPSLLAALAHVSQVASTDAAVLRQGETGTG